MVLETVGLGHTVIYIEVGGQRHLLRGGGLFTSGSAQPLLAVARRGSAALNVRARFGAGVREGPEAGDVGLPVRADVGRGGQMRRGEGFLERPGTK